MGFIIKPLIIEYSIIKKLLSVTSYIFISYGAQETPESRHNFNTYIDHGYVGISDVSKNNCKIVHKYL